MTLNLDRYLKDLEALVTIESPSRNPEGTRKVADFLAEKFERLGWVTEYIDIGSAVGPCLSVCNRKADKYDVLLLGHMDTVFPLGTVAERPFTNKDGMMYGPGVVDMKAGVMYMYYIAECLNGSELLEKTSVCLLFNPDEEISSIYSRRLIEETAAKAACAMIIEPARANGALVNARKGIAKYEIFFKGIPAHAGVAPEKGASAINEMFCWGIELNKLNNPAMGTTLNIGVVQGGTEPNVVAENAMCKIDVRITDVKEAERIEARMRELAANPLDARVTVRIEGGVVRPPLNTTAESLALCERVNAIGKDLGIDVKWVATGGGSDGNFTSALGVPTIDGLGPIGGNTHAATEYGEVASIVPRFNLLLETVKAVLQK
ncbi:MAG: M20 family metallopeptidase [Acholeplasmataceae bacterium]|nr:M20 family metallopeptidase [Acholeplasmataceae bacterium]